MMVEERKWAPKSSGVLKAPAAEETPDASNSRGAKTPYSFQNIERYSKCSLQFRFAEILGLPEKRNAYQDFHNSVYRVLGEMELEAKKTG